MTVLFVLVIARAGVHAVAARRNRRLRRYHLRQVQLLVGAAALGAVLAVAGADTAASVVLLGALAWLFVLPTLLAVLAVRADRREVQPQAQALLRALDVLEPHGHYRERHQRAAAVEVAVTIAARSGRTEEAVRLLLGSGPDLVGWPAAHRARLAVAAAAGRADVVGRVLAGPLADLPGPRAAAWRDAVDPSAVPDPFTTRVLDHVARELEQQATVTPPAGWRALATRVTALALVAVFVLEVARNADGDADRLADMGAYLPGGEPWRALTAMFLHADLLHLGANLLVLLLFGRVVEWRLGRVRAATVYLAAGVLAFLIPDWLGLMPADTVALGASGALLGIIGAALSVGVRWLRSGRAPRSARSEVVLLFAVVVLELLVDLTLPSVFTAGHAAGLVVGAAVGWLLAGSPTRRPVGVPRVR